MKYLTTTFTALLLTGCMSTAYKTDNSIGVSYGQSVADFAQGSKEQAYTAIKNHCGENFQIANRVVDDNGVVHLDAVCG